MHYTIRWTETSAHQITLTAQDLADLRGVTVEQLTTMDADDMRDGLDDELANLADDGLEWLARNEIKISTVDCRDRDAAGCDCPIGNADTT